MSLCLALNGFLSYDPFKALLSMRHNTAPDVSAGWRGTGLCPCATTLPAIWSTLYSRLDATGTWPYLCRPLSERQDSGWLFLRTVRSSRPRKIFYARKPSSNISPVYPFRRLFAALTRRVAVARSIRCLFCCGRTPGVGNSWHYHWNFLPKLDKVA